MKRVKILVLALCLAFAFVLSACGPTPDPGPGPGPGPNPPPEGQTEVQALKSDALAQRVAGEGIVMFKNEGNAIPLKATENKLSVFGWGATNGGFIITGTGSGNASSNKTTYLRAALENKADGLATQYPGADPFGAEFECFPELFQIGQTFQGNRANVGIDSTSQTDLQNMFRLYEPTISADVMARAQAFSPVAIMVVSRLGGENKDLPLWQSKKSQSGQNTVDNSRHYLQLSTEEEALMKQIAGAGFEKIILLVNSCNIMQLDFIDDPAYAIDAVLSVGALGQTGAYGIRRILNGSIQPSGKTVDTWARDVKFEPSYNNGGSRGVRTYTAGGSNYIEYREDIYVGYRYYETAAAEGKIVYDDIVQFPFGYGMTYTDFEWSVTSMSPAAGTAITADTKFKLNVTVKNVGQQPGQDVVQVYVTAPYTAGGIEKPHVVLVGYAKTILLYPENQASEADKKYNEQSLTIEFTAYDFASYDCYDKNANGYMGYELDAGAYEIKLQTDSHNIKTTAKGITNGVIGYTVAAGGVKYDQETKYTDLGGNEITRKPAQNYFTNTDTNKAADENYFGIPIDGAPGTNQTTGSGGGATSQKIPLMSRADFVLPEQAAARPRNYTIYTGGGEKPGWNTPVEGTAPTTGKKNGIVLVQNGKLTEEGQKLGKNYDDPLWNDLLDQMSADDMWRLCYRGGYITEKIDSVGKPLLYDLDGPSGLNSGNQSIPGRGAWTAYPVETTLAQTWSRMLAYSMGLAVGEEAYNSGVGGWYAPACNLHRNAFEGRNFEYFSEDPLLSGLMSADVSLGAHAKGLYTYVKHLVVNETETSRGGLRTWLSEQALRELYLKPFEIAVKRGYATGIMNSFNFLGAVWTGGSAPMQNKIIRGEWGFRGVICTDYFSGSGDWMNADQALRAGTDLWIGQNREPTFGDKGKPAGLILTRNAAHNILYAFTNAWWYQETQQPDNSYFEVVVG